MSRTDIAVLALAVSIELELHGTKRLRSSPGKPSELGTVTRRHSIDSTSTSTGVCSPASLDVSKTIVFNAEATAEAKADRPLRHTGPLESLDQLSIEESGRSENCSSSDDDACGSDSDLGSHTDSSTDDTGDWITLSNVGLHKSRDLGLFPSLDTKSSSSKHEDASGRGALADVACITSDFAMQNVLLQMGVPVIGAGGKRLHSVRTWVLRCHACYKCVSLIVELPVPLLNRIEQIVQRSNQEIPVRRAAMSPFYELPSPMSLHHLLTLKATSFI